MICLLPQLSRQIPDGKNKVFISLSFDKIHWCNPYPLNIIQYESSFSFLEFLAYSSFVFVLIASIKMLCFDQRKGESYFGRRVPPRKPAGSNKTKRTINNENSNEDDPFVFNRKYLGSSFL